MACSEPPFVTLKGGAVASLDALVLLWRLEDRHFILEPVGHQLRVQPVARLTPEDVAAIRHHRDELLTLVTYCQHLSEVM
jgi:hypothetical protein